MDFCILKKIYKQVKIIDLKKEDIIGIIVGNRTKNIIPVKVYCRVDKLRKKNNINYGICVTHLIRYKTPHGSIFIIDPNQPPKNNNPQVTRDPRKNNYNRVNFQLYY